MEPSDADMSGLETAAPAAALGSQQDGAGAAARPFNRSIFRRGSKVELFDDVDADVAEAADLKHKLGNLLAVWGAPRTGKDLAAAIWRPERRCFEVALQRGKLLNHVGFMQGSKLYLHVEEAVYLADRANLLLFLDRGPGEQQQLLSLQEAYDLMVSCGMAMDKFLVYCKLMRAGYIVQRHPANWIVKPFDDPCQVWHMWWDDIAGAAPSGSLVQPAALWSGPDTAAGVGAARAAAAPPPAKRRKAQPATEHAPHGGWWPAEATAPEDWDKLPRAEVMSSAESVAKEQYANMQPLPPLSVLEGPPPSGPSSGRLKLDLDVWPASGARNFSRRAPGAPAFRVAVAPPGGAPTPASLAVLEANAGGIPVRVASVEKADICFYSMDHVSLRSIL